ncbi:MAG: hypothetical protein EOP58_07355, partial [Sphingomonadales bacterium]
LYISRRTASVTQPVLQLKGFERVTLQPGEARTVRFDLPAETFVLWDANMREIVEAGEVDIRVGNSSASLKSALLTIV